MVIRRSPAWPLWTGLLLVLVLFCAPIFTGLDTRDLHNDESIYSYAVDKMVETGVWGTPESIPTTLPFLEKPPLKFWIVSAAIRAGLLPKNEIGFRFFDALFGAITFLYVYAITVRLVAQASKADASGAMTADAATGQDVRASGESALAASARQAVAGVAAVFTLFTMERLLFEHGFRSNNMEGPLVVAYAGGLYHLALWRDAVTLRGRRAHALAVAAWFTLGFMTKFVAAVFLPLTGLIAVLWQPGALRHLRERWTDWIGATALVLAISAPWFIYSTVVHGRVFWEIILGVHVIERMTASLDPTHLQPWHFYYTMTWGELQRAGTLWGVLAALPLLAWRALVGRPWLARLLLVWAIVPLALISGGTSKVYHYAYPFLPPIAAALGLLVAELIRVACAALDRLPRALFVDRLAGSPHASAARLWLRRLLGGVGLLALVVTFVTLLLGSWHLTVGGTLLFRNSSVLRPLIAGLLLTWLAGYARAWSVALPALAIAAVVPTHIYRARVDAMTLVRHPLRTVRDCTHEIQQGSAPTGRGVYNAAYQEAYHSYNYYFARLGPWPSADHPDPAELQRRLFEPAHQTPILLSSHDFGQALELRGPEGTPYAGQSLGSNIDAVSADTGLVIVLPGPYGACATPAQHAGGWRIAVAPGHEATR